ncbi:MAG: hypothetical protein H3C29_08835 [Simplicispira suum]|uniref:hypothetical protein n=1 Tax=Simplicispira suum TaxID=2109915 RepID=UPI001C6C3C3D|nr:hypothetical protein [Simplicispira suum]MBW7833308.1 hypothetical protein [Simplicispira suum]
MTQKKRSEKATTDPKVLVVAKEPSQTTEQALSRAALNSPITGAAVVTSYQGNLIGNNLDLGELISGLRRSCERVNGGNLSELEDMLVSQATALQTMFASLARRAAAQEQLRQYEAFMGLALKAQAQSRATISALVDLKFPRQATFVKQANIAHGPQQVNNGTTTPGGTAHAEKPQCQPNELLEDQSHGSANLDTRATPAPAGCHPEVATLEAIHRPKKHRRKSSGSA